MNFLDTALPGRFWEKCIPEPMSGCWLWIGASNRTDYGVFRYNGASLAHRVALGHVEPLNADLVVDHKCRNTRCVNPAHLRQVTQEFNTQVNYRSTRTHCANGHEFTSKNTYQRAGIRKCRRCHAIKQAARKSRLNARRSGGSK